MSPFLKKSTLIGFVLLLLGMGNMSVGKAKVEQYEALLVKMASISGVGITNNSKNNQSAAFGPLARIDLQLSADNHKDRQQRAQMKKNLYAVIGFGGRIMAIFGISIIIFGLLTSLVSSDIRY